MKEADDHFVSTRSLAEKTVTEGHIQQLQEISGKRDSLHRILDKGQILGRNFIVAQKEVISMSLCGKGNTALFGPCIASAGVRLGLQVDMSETIFPGLTFLVSVRKLDHYGQTVFSDSASFLRIRSQVDTNSSSLHKIPSLAAVLSGTTVFVLHAGHAEIEVAVRPFITPATDASESNMHVQEAWVYAEGIDNETLLDLRLVHILPGNQCFH